MSFKKMLRFGLALFNEHKKLQEALDKSNEENEQDEIQEEDDETHIPDLDATNNLSKPDHNESTQ